MKRWSGKRGCILCNIMGIKNKQNISIQEIEKHYKPLIWESVDKITNLSDETVGYYAYLLQEELKKRDFLAISVLVSDYNGVKNGVLISQPLEEIILPIKDISINREIVMGQLINFELFFMAYNGSHGHPVVLRNGYLLKCLKEAGITDFKELKQYEAVLIYNYAEVNPHLCSFVKFKKKV